jgi:gentisate 1,2-dioxygenase
VLPKHKHPFPRYGYVQAGTIEVTNLDTGKTETFKTGDFILEAVDQWHFGANKGLEPVKLLVIDMVEKGASNTVLQVGPCFEVSRDALRQCENPEGLPSVREKSILPARSSANQPAQQEET